MLLCTDKFQETTGRLHNSCYFISTFFLFSVLSCICLLFPQVSFLVLLLTSLFYMCLCYFYVFANLFVSVKSSSDNEEASRILCKGLFKHLKTGHQSASNTTTAAHAYNRAHACAHYLVLKYMDRQYSRNRNKQLLRLC